MLSSDKIKNMLAGIDPHFLYPVDDNKIYFVEKQKEAKLKRITFTGFDEIVPINQDKFNISPSKNLFVFKGYSKTCDGVFFTIVDNNPSILVFDVKSSRTNTNDHISKMKAGENFVNYIKSTLKIFSNIDISEFKCYFCIFYPEFSPKRETSLRVDISSDPNNPTYIAVENDQTISTRRILGLRI